MRLSKEEIRELSERIIKSVEGEDNTYDEIEVVEKILSEYAIYADC